jgi:hypothetical protein
MRLNLKAREFYSISLCEFNALLSVRGRENIAVSTIYKSARVST